MARTVRDAKLETRAARLRLPPNPNREPYWKSLGQGEALGYYRGAGSVAGSWMARWRPPGGTYKKQKLGQADDVREADGLRVLSFGQAQAKAREWFAERNRVEAGHAPVPAGPYRVRDAVADYLAWFTRHRKSVADTVAKAERYILPLLGDEEIGRLTAARIREWHEAIAASPRGRRHKGEIAPKPQAKPATPEELRARRSTANRVLIVLRAALSHAFAEGKVASDAAWRRVKPFRGADAARQGYLTEEQCRRLLNACEPDFRRIVRGALETGCRYGELTRAKVADFHPDAPSLLIRDTKSGKPRHVPLDRQAAAFLESITAGRPGKEPIFLRDDGKPWGTSQQARRLAEASLRAGIEPPINFHGLRHTWASLRIMKGMPLIVAAQVLGHSTTRMVERHYGHLAKGYVQQAVEETSFELPPEPSAVTPMRRR